MNNIIKYKNQIKFYAKKPQVEHLRLHPVM